MGGIKREIPAKVAGLVADECRRRDKPYRVVKVTAVEEDGCLLEKMRSYQIQKPDEAEKKWRVQSQAR